jgi:hypothetical protein
MENSELIKKLESIKKNIKERKLTQSIRIINLMIENLERE